MSQKLMELVEKSSLKAEPPKFDIGDTVDVHTKILEGTKERIQIFSGVVIARSGSGTREMFVVRRIVAGDGVERPGQTLEQRRHAFAGARKRGFPDAFQRGRFASRDRRQK